MKKFISVFLGNLFEHYDTALFSFLSPFLAPLIFPNHDPLSALILTYAFIPLGTLLRPIGSLIFGYIGDRYGRERALFLTLAGMSLVSGCIAFTPTYQQIGILAPIIFYIGRALQNCLAAGETMGGAIYLLENTKAKNHDLLSSIYCSSTMAGHLLASFGVFLLGSFHSGWRILYLFGCVTALFGTLLRRGGVQKTVRVKTNLWAYKKQVLIIALAAGFAYANYAMALVIPNGFIPLVTNFSKTEILKLNSYLLIFDFCVLPLFGYLASKIRREKLMVGTAVAVILLSAPLLIALKGGSLITIILVRTAFVLFGVAFFAPFHAWAQELVPPSCRYAAISLGYALGTQILGSPTSAIALWCFQKTGIAASIGWYPMVLGGISILTLFAALRMKRTMPLTIG